MGDLFKYVCSDGTGKEIINGEKRKRTLQIFTGSHCFPLSPKKVVFDPDGLPSTEGDLLDSIFDLIGTPDEADLSFITDEQAKSYVRKFKKRPRANFKEVFPKISSEGLYLLQQMLQFNPFMRPSVEQCL